MEDIFHEVHITVKHKDSFEKDCISLDVKPIIIDMGEDIPTHSMTSSTYKNNSDAEVYSKALNLKSNLESIGYVVERLKIETVPWHPQGFSPLDTQYFEAHFVVTGAEIPKETLKKFDLHRSKNLLKKEDKLLQMLTYRKKNINSFEFKTLVDSLTDKLNSLVTVNKVIREFAIYDSNVSLDAQWLSL